MAKRSDFRDIQKFMRKKKTPEKKISYLLEQTSPQAIRHAKEFSEKLLNYQWKFYYELAQQREKILDKIKEALLKNVTEKYKFSKWQRAVKWAYSHHPMCTIGSRTFVGNRFNYGEEINSQITGFPCLYLAINKDTALQETLGQSAFSQGLSAKEIALSNSQSESIVSISGLLDQIIDLRNEKSLKNFVKLISKFKLSKEVTNLARELGDQAGVITTPKLLHETLLEPNWTDRPVNYQIPSNSQIFGQLVSSAGIHGILYPSKLTKKDCLAIYVQNFKNTDCYLEFDDQQPDGRVPKRINASNFEITAQAYSQLILN